MVEVAVERDYRERQISGRAIRRVIGFVLKKELVRDGKISVVLVGDRLIRKINTAYLGHNVPTDVITFPIEQNPVLEAEIYINVRQARRQAREYGVTIVNELTRLVIHGVLHAVGYDDRRTKERKKMFELQERYVRVCTATRRAI